MTPDPSTAIEPCIAGLQERIHQNATELNQLRRKAEEHTERSIKIDEVSVALHDFDNLCDARRPREQQRVLALFVSLTEFDATDNSIKIDFMNSNIASKDLNQSFTPF